MHAENRGFSLLITIVLLSFLVLLLVALAALTRVETAIAATSAQLSVARQNALVSLNLALGRLQEFCGPDDRVTARSDLTASGPSFQPHLTGVWRTANTTGTPDAWLINGAADNPQDLSAALDPSLVTGLYGDGSTPWVFLVGDNTVDAPSQRVRLARHPLRAQPGSVPGITGTPTIGHYAWWVGDEGIKASATLVDPLRDVAPISYDNTGGIVGDDWSDLTKRDRLNQLQPPRPRIERLFPSLSPDAPATVAQMQRVSHLAQLDLLSGGPSTAQRKATFHALTPLAEAVLLDQRSSPPRLRRDLSDLSGTITPAFASNAIRAYQQFRVSIPSSASPYEAVYQPAQASSFGITFPVFSAGPVLSEFGLRAFFSLDSANQIILNYIVEAELWNPYSARLETTAASPLSLAWSADHDLEVVVKDDQGGSHSVNITALVRDANGMLAGQPAGTLIGSGETWNPGEIRTVSGSTTLTTGGGFGTIPTGRTATAGSTGLPTVDLPALGAAPLKHLELDVRLNRTAGPARIQRYDFQHLAYIAATVANDGTTPAFGYGYSFYNRLRRWTWDSAGRDPRGALLSGTVLTSGAINPWNTNPAANAFHSPDGTFCTLPAVVLFDLPRQELVSVGELRQLIGDEPAEMGSVIGGADNEWFDKYFFSTVPRNHAWDFAGGEPLPNRYLRYLPSERTTATLTDLRDDDAAARFLAIRGAFNLNSTSVDAWRMVLGARIENWQGAAGGPQTLDNVFLRLPQGAQQLTNVAMPDSGLITNDLAVTTGGRRLTEDQITTIATSIVAGLKTQGRPFNSIVPFLNAIGGGGLINTGLTNANVSGLNGTTADARDDARATPGAVTQADIVAQLAPFLTARSDTFRVRAYGDTVNPATNTVAARAWCEAVVQRVPDLTDPTSGTHVAGDETTINTSKYPFGRKFKIISFRWLSPADI